MAVHLAQNLIYLRKLKGLSQKAFADLIGLNQSTYSNYENDYSKPDFSILEEILTRLQIDAHSLLYRQLKEDYKNLDKNGAKESTAKSTGNGTPNEEETGGEEGSRQVFISYSEKEKDVLWLIMRELKAIRQDVDAIKGLKEKKGTL